MVFYIYSVYNNSCCFIRSDVKCEKLKNKHSWPKLIQQWWISLFHLFNNGNKTQQFLWELLISHGCSSVWERKSCFCTSAKVRDQTCPFLELLWVNIEGLGNLWRSSLTDKWFGPERKIDHLVNQHQWLVKDQDNWGSKLVLSTNKTATEMQF